MCGDWPLLTEKKPLKQNELMYILYDVNKLFFFKKKLHLYVALEKKNYFTIDCSEENSYQMIWNTQKKPIKP